MIYVSDIYNTTPNDYLTPLQQQAYQTLEKLHVPFERVETDELSLWRIVLQSTKNWIWKW